MTFLALSNIYRMSRPANPRMSANSLPAKHEFLAASRFAGFEKCVAEEDTRYRAAILHGKASPARNPAFSGFSQCVAIIGRPCLQKLARRSKFRIKSSVCDFLSTTLLAWSPSLTFYLRVPFHIPNTIAIKIPNADSIRVPAGPTRRPSSQLEASCTKRRNR